MSFTQREYSGKEELLIPESILGYRQWYWERKRLYSRSDTDWNEESLTAECKLSSVNDQDHSSPDIDCTCGIYAHYLPLESYPRKNNVFGVVEASGRILMGTKGFRAEKAKIVALSGYGDSDQWFQTEEKTRGIFPPDLVDFCTRIGVPYFPTVKQMVHEFPQVDLSSLGVPSLYPWKTKRDYDKKQYELQEIKNKKKLEEAKEMEQEMYRRYGVTPSDKPGSASYRMAATMRHLGGYS